MWQVIGQDRAVSFLQRSLACGALGHAYLFVGPPHVGKTTLGLGLAQAVNCTANEPPCGDCVTCQRIASGKHADVQVIGLAQNEDAAEAKLISIDQIRDCQHAVSLPPFEGKRKVFIIQGAELLSLEAANCLLKTLEEPASGVLFILLTVNDRLLPPTVVSRCQRIELVPVPASEIEKALLHRGAEAAKAKLLAHLAEGRLGWALSAILDNRLLEERAAKMESLIAAIGADREKRFGYAGQLAAQFSQSREAAQGILELWLGWWHDILLAKMGCSDLIGNVDRLEILAKMAGCYRLTQIRDFIESIRGAQEQLKQNASPRLVFEVLMMDIPEKEVNDCTMRSVNRV